MSDTQRYYEFLRSKRYDRIMRYTSNQLEEDHAFIQWLFPTTTPSRFNNTAPVIDIIELKSHPDFQSAREKIINSLYLIMKHWGIDENFEVFDFNRFKLLNGHNGLRLSRVLQSLIYHDLKELAEKLLATVLMHENKLLLNFIGDITIWELRFEEASAEV